MDEITIGTVINFFGMGVRCSSSSVRQSCWRVYQKKCSMMIVCIVYLLFYTNDPNLLSLALAVSIYISFHCCSARADKTTARNTRPKGIRLKSRIARVLKNSLQVKKRRVFARECSLTHIATIDDGRFRIERETKSGVIMMITPLLIIFVPRPPPRHGRRDMNTTNPDTHG